MLRFRSEKGQAFDVFKLLIAAIVAVAILGILMAIIGVIGPIFKNDPTAETSMKISDLIQKPDTWNTTEKVTFVSKTNLSSSALAQKTPLAKDQICFSRGDFMDDSTWQYIGGDSPQIFYNGSSDKDVEIGVMCSKSQEDLESSLQATADAIGKDSVSELEECQCGNQTCCAVVILKT